MSPTLLMVLSHADSLDTPRGAALMAEEQSGRKRQVNILLSRRLVRLDGGRIVTTKKGRRALAKEGWAR